MDVRLSREQQALRDAAARVVDRLGPETVAQIADHARASELSAAVAASGWRELRCAAEGGGPLASGVEAAIVAEELGRGPADASFLGPTLAAELRRLAGAPPSEEPETVALDGRLRALARGAGDDGRPVVAVDTEGSTGALLILPDGEGGRLARADLPATASAPAGPDLTRPSAVLDPHTRVTPVEGADRPLAGDLTRWSALGLAVTCADLVGTMRGAVELACAYAAHRRQYGVAIGSFQAVQHLLADAFVATEGARSVTLHAAWGVDALPPGEALAAAAVAKAYCARAARRVCETGIQVHGGIGNTWECLAHVYLRRALLSADVLGNAPASLAHVLAHHGIGGRDGLR